MTVRPPPTTPVLCGPTAGGKSDLALALVAALRDRFNLPAELISADAFQVYQGLDIGTAKPTLEDRRAVPHHLIDIVDPCDRHPASGIGHSATRRDSSSTNAECRLPNAVASPPNATAFTVQSWLTLATRAIADIRARRALPIVVGGTHLYIKALLDGLFEGPEPDPALRAELAAMDPAARRAELERADPAAAQRIHPNDSRRTIRALEVFRLTGKPITDHQTQWDSPNAECRMPNADFLPILLTWPPTLLNPRVNARVRSMLDRGLVDEIRSLLSRAPLAPQPAEALGYKQLIPIVREAMASGLWPPPAAAIAAAAEDIKIETRRFAKNQRTWLRRLRTTPGTLSIPMPSTPTPAAVDSILTALGLLS